MNVTACPFETVMTAGEKPVSVYVTVAPDGIVDDPADGGMLGDADVAVSTGICDVDDAVPGGGMVADGLDPEVTIK